MAKRLLWLILILEYCYIFGILQNYDNAFMHPEKTLTHYWIFENGPSFKLEDIRRGMDVHVIEWGEPRFTRPFSNIVEVINAKFRATLWKYIPPHPSLHLSWPFSFVLLPYLLFLFFRNMGCNRDLSLGGVCLYMASPGFLCPTMFLFHPGMNFVNFFTVLNLFLVSRIMMRLRAEEGQIVSARRYMRAFAVLMAFLFQTFFWHETSLFVFGIILFALSPFFLKTRPKGLMIGLFSLLPLFYFLIVKLVLPLIHVKLGYQALNIDTYSATPPLRNLFLPDLSNLVKNMIYLFGEHFHIGFHPFGKNPGVPLSILAVMHFICFLLLAGPLLFVLYKQYWRKKLAENSQELLFGFGIFLLLLFAYVYFQTFIFSNLHGALGVYYYGSMFSLMFAIFVTFCLSIILQYFHSKGARMCIVVIIAVFVADSLVFTTYRQNIYKTSTSTFAFPMKEVFEGIKNQYDYYSFKQSFRQSRKKRSYVINFWRNVNQMGPLKDYSPDVAEESEYVFLDLIKGMLSSELLRTAETDRNFVLQPTQLFFEDINGDKKADALYYDTTIRDRGFVHIGLSRGNDFAKFVKSLEFWVEGNSRIDGSGKNAEKRMKFADVNGDGHVDALYFETWRSYTVWVSFGAESGFSRPVTCLRYGRSVPEQLQYADVNGDGKADALYFDAGRTGSVWVSLSGGEGFAKAVQWIRYGQSSPEQIQYADVNGDGMADALYLDTVRDNGVWVGLSTGKTFEAPTLWAHFKRGLPERIQYADVNGDGSADAICFDRSGDGGIHVSLSTGKDFGDASLWLQHGRFLPQQMRYADVDGDGKADALFVDPTSFQIVIYRSSGSQFAGKVEPSRTTQHTTFTSPFPVAFW